MGEWSFPKQQWPRVCVAFIAPPTPPLLLSDHHSPPWRKFLSLPSHPLLQKKIKDGSNNFHHDNTEHSPAKVTSALQASLGHQGNFRQRGLLDLCSLFGQIKYRTDVWFNVFTEGSSKAMAAINAAMRLWRTKTCVQFKKKTTEHAYAYFHIGRGWEKGLIFHESMRTLLRFSPSRLYEPYSIIICVSHQMIRFSVQFVSFNMIFY